MQCNIDQRGRRARAIGGVVAIAVAVIMLVILPRERLAWVIATILFLAGLFQLFEAWKGWCAIRALGIRTPV